MEISQENGEVFSPHVSPGRVALLINQRSRNNLQVCFGSRFNGSLCGRRDLLAKHLRAFNVFIN